MEARNITIVTTSNQNKYVVSTDATTLRELKSALAQQSIPYEGMTFYEGLSHTELLTDDSVLPHDVPYKGNVTNELVFMLTTPNKKIRSGANLSEARQALYDAIDEYGLKETCIQTYGKNFTQCKNSELMSLIEEAEAKKPCCSSNHCGEALMLLVKILVDDEYILPSEGRKIVAVLEGNNKGTESSYSGEEIEEMFEFLN